MALGFVEAKEWSREEGFTFESSDPTIKKNQEMMRESWGRLLAANEAGDQPKFMTEVSNLLFKQFAIISAQEARHNTTLATASEQDDRKDDHGRTGSRRANMLNA